MSIADGRLELMLHRRLLYDDGRGVDQALNETICVFEKCVVLTDDKFTKFPDSVAIVILQELEDQTVLLRLAHLYEV
ncbi:putative alpha-mannosidase At5g13980 isoform X4 [Primulina tabacum]|uniref:putative alpha-mannosidase At5g13980 isoform X4 n=1 Tax=Primulina tabacum TaxID=48773 RepID=UPI003F5A9966